MGSFASSDVERVRVEGSIELIAYDNFGNQLGSENGCIKSISYPSDDVITCFRKVVFSLSFENKIEGGKIQDTDLA